MEESLDILRRPPFEAFLVCLVVTSVALPFVVKSMQHFQVMDVPNERSSHTLPTPRGGGLALLLGLLAGWLMTPGWPVLGMVFAVSGAILGIADDWRSLPAFPRLAIQLALAVFACVVLIHAGALQSWILAVLVTLFLVTAINTANFMDGINGLLSLNAIIIACTYGLLLLQPDSEWGIMCLGIAGACLAFLPWNFRGRARLFLGDSGSYLLGCALGLLAVQSWLQGTSLIAAVAPLFILLIDVLATLTQRLLRRRRLTEAHREHVYQRLTAEGFSQLLVSTTVGLFTAIACGLGFMIHVKILGELQALPLLLLVGATYLLLPSVMKGKHLRIAAAAGES